MYFTSPLSLELPVTSCIYKYLTFHYPAGIVLTPLDSKLSEVWKMVQSSKVSTYRQRSLKLDSSFSKVIPFEIKRISGQRAQLPFNYMEINMINEYFKLCLLDDLCRFLNVDRDNCTMSQDELFLKFRDVYGFTEEELPYSWLKQATSIVSTDAAVVQSPSLHTFKIVYGDGPSTRQVA